jgi:hypothetical protein
MNSTRSQSAFAHAALAVTLVAACGGGAPPPATPPQKTETVPAPTGAGTAAVTTPPAPPSSSTGAAPSPPHALTASVAFGPSQMLGELKTIGVDPTHPGDLSKMEMSKKRKVMKLFVKALGMENCEGCHAPGDFKADTPKKKLAGGMWNHFVRGLKTKSGEPIFCDSCHQGHDELLVRSDKKALSAFMKANYEDKLDRTDKKDHSCETCHGDPFEGKVFAKLWKIAR